MAYLNGPASGNTFGVVEIGANILVDANGIISIPQDVADTANITFNELTITSIANIATLIVENETDTGNLSVGGKLIVTSNTASTSTTSGAVIVTGGVGVSGNVYATALFDSDNRVVTHVVPTAGTGIVISNLTSTGTNVAFTISSTGTTIINVIQTLGPTYSASSTDDYIGVYSATATTINLPVGINGHQYTIKDEYGQGSGKITVTPAGTEKIDSANVYIISVPFASISVVYRGGGQAPGWHII